MFLPLIALFFFFLCVWITIGSQGHKLVALPNSPTP
jgi:hypothetical protein